MASEPRNTSTDFQHDSHGTSCRRRLSRCSARPLLLTSRPRRGWLALQVGSCAADRVRLLASVTCVTLHTLHGVAHGIRATEYKHRSPKRQPRNFVQTAFASLLSTPCCSRHDPRRGWLALPVGSCAAESVRVLASVTCMTLHTPHAVAHGIRVTEYKHRFPKRQPRNIVQTALVSLLGTPCC